ncbi:MAG: protein kinase [Sumerlaeia bacterium]
MAIDLSLLPQIGPYTINQCLGTNGVVATYDVTSLQGERFCLVAMPVEQLAQPTGWSQAEQAAQRLQSGMPPGVLVPEHFGQENDVYFMVYPFILGVHLGGFVNANGLPTPFQTIDIAIGVLENLKQLHNLGISHRVINPASIFLPEGDSPVLLHGGWSRMLLNAQNGPLNENLMSNLPFLAPEIISQQGADFPADVYGLAANLFFLFTGQPLFWDDSPETLGQQIVSQAPDLSPLNSLNTPELNDLLEEMLEKDPEDRPPNLDALTNRFLNIQNAFPDSKDITTKNPASETQSYSDQATIRISPEHESYASLGEGEDPTVQLKNQTSADDLERPPSARELHQQNKRKNQHEQIQRAQEAAEMAKLEKQRQAELERQAAIEKQKEEMRKKREMVKKIILVVSLLIVVLILTGITYAIYAYISREEQAGTESIIAIKEEQEVNVQKIIENKEQETKMTQTREALKVVGSLNAEYLKKYGIWISSFEDFAELHKPLPENYNDGWGTPFQIRTQGFIMSAGPDAEFDTADDLWIDSDSLEIGP